MLSGMQERNRIQLVFILDFGRLSFWNPADVPVADPEEFRDRREHGDTGIQLHRWRADRRRGSHCTDDWHCGGDCENNSGVLLDKTSKGG